MTGKRALLLAALLLALGATTAAATDVFHFALKQSAPAADATVPPPDEVRLWFTEAPTENSIGIRVIDEGGDPVATSDPTADPDDGAVFFVEPSAPLTAGRYTVSWRGIGDDGHVVRGDFAFSVTAE